MSAAAHRLDDVRVLLDDLFSFAQVHDPSFEVAYEPVRPADVLGDVLAGLYPQFRERGWEPRVLLDDEAVVQADAEALARIFRNLTANALRPVSYTHLLPAAGGQCAKFAPDCTKSGDVRW